MGQRVSDNGGAADAGSPRDGRDGSPGACLGETGSSPRRQLAGA